MPVKFTNAKKWDDVWFSQLSMKEKVMFLYLCDMCDIAGFLEINKTLVSLQTGIQNVDETINSLSKSIVYNDGYIWIKTYIKHQKNLPINLKNGAHKSIVRSIEEQIKRFPEVFKTLPVSDIIIIKAALGREGEAPPPPPSTGISISNSISKDNTITMDTVQGASKVARLYKYFVGEANLMGQGIPSRVSTILAEALQYKDVEDWKVFCEARLQDEYKASPSKFFLEDGWRRYEDKIKQIVMEKKKNDVKRKERKERAELPEQEAPEEFKEFVKNFGKRIARDTEIQTDPA